MNDSKETGEGQLRQQIWVEETRPPSAAPAVLKGSLNSAEGWTMAPKVPEQDQESCKSWFLVNLALWDATALPMCSGT